MQLLYKNISLSKKVEFTLSSKIVQGACLFLFSGFQFCFKTHRRAISLIFSISFYTSYHVEILLCLMQICPPEKTNISFQLNPPLRRGEETHLEIF